MGGDFLILINIDYNTVISENLTVADTYFKRLKGLMFTKELPSQNALQIIPCSEIHTFFMNYSIDVLYLDGNNNIVYMDEKLQSGKIGKYVKNARSVIELPAGKIKETNIKVGQTVQCINKLK
ncbi:MAG: hypothetical protein K0R54_5338 [Clostridiaceae bacterium]|jgi:uncharacterized membrane protein (UPF0127 family)|nr:hypothetical protein [Clostridiaceae bacterium]